MRVRFVCEGPLKIAAVLIAALIWCAGARAAESPPAPRNPQTGLSIGVMQRLERAHWIPEGAREPARVVYVFTDPECPYCNKLWKALRSVRGADVQIRYLLVAVIDADSPGKDAAILEARDPAAALQSHEQRYAQGGIPPRTKMLPATRETISVNGDLMGALHIYGTPGLVYLNEAGEVSVFSGVPDATQLQSIFGSRGSKPQD